MLTISSESVLPFEQVRLLTPLTAVQSKLVPLVGISVASLGKLMVTTSLSKSLIAEKKLMKYLPLTPLVVLKASAANDAIGETLLMSIAPPYPVSIMLTVSLVPYESYVVMIQVCASIPFRMLLSIRYLGFYNPPIFIPNLIFSGISLVT
jgi:hypothetical protein